MSVVFDISVSLNDVAPVPLMSLSVYVKKKEWFVDGYLLCVLFLFSSLFRMSFVSVVFDFSASLSRTVPEFSMSLPFLQE